MLRWALIFFVIALVAALLGAGGVAGISYNIAIALLVVAVIFLIIGLVSGRGKRTTV